jgi:hypothetical protein
LNGNLSHTDRGGGDAVGPTREGSRAKDAGIDTTAYPRRIGGHVFCGYCAREARQQIDAAYHRGWWHSFLLVSVIALIALVSVNAIWQDAANDINEIWRKACSSDAATRVVADLEGRA